MLGLPIFDTCFAFIRRIAHGQSPMHADRGHIHHQLLKEGFSQRKTVLIMWGWTAILAVSAIFITETDGILRLVFVAIAAGVSMYFIIHLHLLGPVLRHHYDPRPATGQRRANEEFNRAMDSMKEDEMGDEK